ncbi:hypothetical protein [Pyruvatibacter mobilis]
MKDNLIFIGLVGVGVMTGLAAISFLRRNNVPLLTDFARMAHDGADGAGA